MIATALTPTPEPSWPELFRPLRIATICQELELIVGLHPGLPLQPRNGMTNRVMSARSSRVRAAGFRTLTAIATLAATAALTALAAVPAAARQAGPAHPTQMTA